VTALANHLRGGALPALCVVAVAMVAFLGDGTLLNLATVVAIYALWGTSLNIIWGYAGQFSLAQVGFSAVSAYLAAVLARAGWGFWSAAAAAVVVATVVAVVISFMTLRLTGFLFAIMTLTFVLLLVSVLRSLDQVGRSSGMLASSDLGVLDLGFGRLKLLPGTPGFLILCSAFVAVAVLGVGQLLRTRSGRAFLAVRGDEVLADSLGVRPSTYRLLAFLLSAFVAGVAGVLYGTYLGFISPDFFGFKAILELIIIVVIGGRGALLGPVLGGAVYFGLQLYLGVSDLVYGLVLIAVVLLAPSGLAGVPAALRRGWSTLLDPTSDGRASFSRIGARLPAAKR